MITSVSVDPQGTTAGGRNIPYDSDRDEPLPAITDEELVGRILGGEEDAFRHLYERYRRPLSAAVCRILHDSEETRDAVQEIFIKAYRSLGNWNPERGKLSTWLHRLATNHAIDRWRKRRSRAELQLGEVRRIGSIKSSVCRIARRPVERSLENRERAEQVKRCLEELPQPQKRFFMLRYYDGLMLKEIAAREGFKLGTVKTSLFRATRRLRRKLREREHEDVSHLCGASAVNCC